MSEAKKCDICDDYYDEQVTHDPFIYGPPYNYSITRLGRTSQKRLDICSITCLETYAARDREETKQRELDIREREHHNRERAKQLLSETT